MANPLKLMAYADDSATFIKSAEEWGRLKESWTFSEEPRTLSQIHGGLLSSPPAIQDRHPFQPCGHRPHISWILNRLTTTQRSPTIDPWPEYYRQLSLAFSAMARYPSPVASTPMGLRKSWARSASSPTHSSLLPRGTTSVSVGLKEGLVLSILAPRAPPSNFAR